MTWGYGKGGHAVKTPSVIERYVPTPDRVGPRKFSLERAMARFWSYNHVWVRIGSGRRELDREAFAKTVMTVKTRGSASEQGSWKAFKMLHVFVENALFKCDDNGDLTLGLYLVRNMERLARAEDMSGVDLVWPTQSDPSLSASIAKERAKRRRLKKVGFTSIHKLQAHQRSPRPVSLPDLKPKV